MHEEKWEIYPSQLKEEFALFAVDLGVAEAAPVPELGQMHWLRVVFETERPDGMPDPDEAEKLAEVESWWSGRFQAVGGLHVGRMTCAGRREFFAYAGEAMIDDLEAEARRIHGERYQFEANVRPDPSWEVYAGFLYPDPMAQRRIANFKQVTTLRHQGDVATRTRPIDHHARFAEDAARAQFVEEVVEAGLEVVSQEAGEGAMPYEVQFRSMSTTDLATIDAIVLPLWMRARDLEGAYDGWGTSIIEDQDTSS